MTRNRRRYDSTTRQDRRRQADLFAIARFRLHKLSLCLTYSGNSTNTTPELPTRRSRAAHWRSQLPQEDRVDPIELRKQLRLLLVDKFGEDFVPRPVQIEALAGLFQLERFKTRNQYDAVFVIAPKGSGKSLKFQAMYVVYGRRAVTIVVSPLTALSQHQVGFIRLAVEATPVLSPTVLIPLQADNLNQERKKAVVICKKT
ncbi:BQ5605_C012g06809 [Microbotryum silenes-dioicae]|uniref:BQ5605_C012g06809 protein n=1 Tax=Microbotryum silenes-dioicae TaxID=796604 RepID=A0A2X0MLK8_9BASI|nr:BQ5605_C012g06809 [Microbotryum silenes-dioicae]